MKMKVLVGMLVLCLLLVACSRASGSEYWDKAAGFWDGVWHGMTQGFILLWDTFFKVEDPMLYAANNTGYWYNCGFSCAGPLILAAISGVGVAIVKGVLE
jgi:hypothetical protein